MYVVRNGCLQQKAVEDGGRLAFGSAPGARIDDRGLAVSEMRNIALHAAAGVTVPCILHGIM